MKKHYTNRYIVYLLLTAVSLFVAVIANRVELSAVSLPFLVAAARIRREPRLWTLLLALVLTLPLLSVFLYLDDIDLGQAMKLVPAAIGWSAYFAARSAVASVRRAS